jgi:streptogramin lyase
MKRTLWQGTLFGIFALSTTLAAGSAGAQVITEFRIPSSGSFPFEITPGPGGMWFTETGANRIGLITLDGRVSEFPVNRPANGIVAGPDGNLWFTSQGFLSRMTTAGVITDFLIAGTGFGITVGADRNIWFVEESSTTSTNSICRATVDGQITKFRATNDEPGGIALGPDGNLWFTDFGEIVPSRIGRITPSGVLTEFTPPVQHAGGIAAGPDGNLWFTALGQGVGRISPSGDTAVFRTGDAGYGIAAGPDGNLWFASANKIGRITTSGNVTEFPIPTPDARPGGISAGPDGNIWFTESGSSRIGRISLLNAGDADPLYLSGGRFKVTVSWQSPTDSGQGHPVSLTADAGYFWFFDSANVEIVVKVLDGCSTYGHKWVFAGGLTNVSVVMTVTDMQTGQSKTYINPQGTAFLPIQDTDAFSSCP